METAQIPVLIALHQATGTRNTGPRNNPPFVCNESGIGASTLWTQCFLIGKVAVAHCVSCSTFGDIFRLTSGDRPDDLGTKTPVRG